MAISVFLWNSIHMKYFIASSNPSLSVWVILWGYNFLVTSTRLLFFLPPFILCLLIGEFKMLTLVIDKVLARAMCGLSSILLQLLSFYRGHTKSSSVVQWVAPAMPSPCFYFCLVIMMRLTGAYFDDSLSLWNDTSLTRDGHRKGTKSSHQPLILSLSLSSLNFVFSNILYFSSVWPILLLMVLLISFSIFFSSRFSVWFYLITLLFA